MDQDGLNPPVSEALKRVKTGPQPEPGRRWAWLDEHKQDALVVISALGRSEAARRMGLTPHTLYTWAKERKLSDFPHLRPTGRPKVARAATSSPAATDHTGADYWRGRAEAYEQALMAIIAVLVKGKEQA